MGLNIIFFNSFYQYPVRYKIVWRHLLGFLYNWVIVYGGILALAIYLAVPSEAAGNILPIILWVCVPAMLFENTNTIGSYYYRAQAKPVPVVVISALSGLVTVVFNYFTIVQLKMGYMGWFVSLFVASFFSFIFYSYLLYFKYGFYPILRVRLRYIKRYLKVSLPLVPHNYAGYLLDSSDRAIMKYVHISTAQIGLYNLAYLFGNYFGMFEFAIGQAAAPIFMKLYHEKNFSEARKLAFVIQVVFFVTSFLSCLWLKEIFALLIRNDQMQSAYYIAIIIIMGYNYRPMYYVSTNYLFYKQKTATLMKISFTAALLNIILNLFFLPAYGIFAGAVTTFVCLTFLGYTGLFLKSFKSHMKLDHYPLVWLMLMISLTFLVFFIRDISVASKLMISIAVLGVSAAFINRFKNMLVSQATQKNLIAG
jgi:O-antigen/teichoic acid export membrane protein